MKAFFLAWLAIIVVFLVIDAIWLGLVAKSFYRRHLGDLMLEQPKLHIAAVFYMVYAVAILVLASMPAAQTGSLIQALMLGALLGFTAYGTYDITNMATLKNWPTTMSVVDMIWGTCLTAITSAAGYIALRYAASS